jgi:hypothetical protein
MDGEHRIEEVREPDAVGLGDRRKRLPSPSKLQGRPCSTTSMVGSSCRKSSRWSTFPSGVV